MTNGEDKTAGFSTTKFANRIDTTKPASVESARMISVNGTAVLANNMISSKANTVVHENVMRNISPDLALAFDRFRPRTGGQQRKDLHLPTLICPVDVPNDRTRFENPDDPGQRYTLHGVFQLASTIIGTSPGKWVELRPDDSGHGYTLEVHLASLPDGTDTAGTIPVVDQWITKRCFLSATVQGMAREWDFGDIRISGQNWTLQLQLDGDDAIIQRDALYRAMTESPDARLTIRRSLQLAFQNAPPPEPIRPWPPPHPPGPINPPHPPGPARNWELMQVRKSQTLRTLQPDPSTNGPAPSDTYEPLYRVVTSAIDSNVAFNFSKDLDKNVFARLTEVGTTQTGWNHHTIPWQSEANKTAVMHDYYQDRSEPRAVYFFPDEYRIQRSSEQPHRPMLNVSLLDNEDKLSIGYIAVPVWDQTRIDAAFSQLQSEGVPANAWQPVLFRAANARLRLKIPNGNPAGGPGYVEQAGVVIQTDYAINGNLTVSIDDFREAFDAVINDDSDLLNGKVDVTVDAWITQIDFTMRADRFSGSTFDVVSSVDKGSGTIKVSARNVIESPISVASLPVTILKDGHVAVTSVISTIPALPAVVAAGADGQGGAIEVVLAVQDGLADDIKISCDFSQTRVVPDGKALLDTILDPTIEAHSSRDVKVNLPTVVFFPTANDGNKAPVPIAVQVEFEAGSTEITFSAPPQADSSTLLTQVAHLHLLLRDFLSGQELGKGLQYRYRVRAIYGTGDKIGDWLTDYRDDIFITLPSA